MPDSRVGLLTQAEDSDSSRPDCEAVSACLLAAGVWTLSNSRRGVLARQLLTRHGAAAIAAAVRWHVERGRCGAWIAQLLADPIGVERTLAAMGWRLPVDEVDATPAHAVEVLLLRAGLFERAPAERAELADRLVRLQRFTADDVAAFLVLHLRRGATCAWLATKLRREPEAVARARAAGAAPTFTVGRVSWIMRRRVEAITEWIGSRWAVEEDEPVARATVAREASPASHAFHPPAPPRVALSRLQDRARPARDASA